MRQELMIALCVFAGCNDQTISQRAELQPLPQTKQMEHATTTVSDVVARVNGAAISRDELRWLASEADAGVESDKALDALIRNELLAQEALRLGFGEHPEVGMARQGAMARALLKNRVGSIGPAEIDRDKLKRYYEAKKGLYVHDILRRVLHFVALTSAKKNGSVPEEEGRAVVAKLAKLAREVSTEEAFANLKESLTLEERNLVRLERLPPFEARTKMFERGFVDAAFAIGGVGRASEPIRTSFGWHVIYVAEVLPAVNRSFAEVEAELASEVLPPERELRAKELVEKLYRNNNVFVYESAVSAQESAP